MVVAALPMDILPISPSASISTSERYCEVDATAVGAAAGTASFLNRASISSCDKKLSLMFIPLFGHGLRDLYGNAIIGAAWFAFEFLMLSNNHGQFIINP